MKKITIVTVCLNSELFIEQAIKSILNQNYSKLEYIIVDGGSTDNTANIINKYIESISCFVSEPDEGMYYALKKGFDLATGEIVGWTNADDVLLPGALHNINRIFSDFSDCLWITGFPTISNVENSIFPGKLSHLKRLYKNFEYLNGPAYCIQQESSFFKKSLYDAVGGISTKYKLAGDYDLWAKFFKKTKLYVFDCLIGSFRVHKNQLSSDNTSYKKELLEIRSKHNEANYKLKYLCFRLFSMLCKLLPSFVERKILSLYLQDNRYYYNKKTDVYYKKSYKRC